MKPFVSIIIPTINRQAVILDTIAVFQNDRTFEEFELIVVDQSADRCTELVELSERDQRIRYFNVDFRGTTRARNFGVKNARADLIVFSEDDVIPCAGYLNAYREHFADTPALGATGPVLVPGQGLRSREQLSTVERARLDSLTQEYFDADFPHSAVFGAGGNSAFRRTAILELGGFDEEYFGNAWGEEAEFGHRFRRQFGRIDYLPAASVVHLVHATGGSRTLRNESYVRNFCRNSIYSHCRMNAGWTNTAKECWGLVRRFVLNKPALRRPKPHWIGLIALGCIDGFVASRRPRKLPLTPAASNSYSERKLSESCD